MEFTPEEMVLATGTPDEVDDLVTCERCAIIDWRADPEEVVAAFQQFLPPGFLRADFMDEEEIVIHLGSRSETVRLAENAVAIPLADTLRQLLAPEYHAFLFRDSLESDTACYFIRHMVWWDYFRAHYPQRFASIFTEANHEA